MNQRKIGIDDISFYIPASRIDLETLKKRRIKENPRLERHLKRALRVTGQRAIRFPGAWEDTATMAATSAYRLLANSKPEDLGHIRHIAVGTESSLDHSKPVASYVQGMLQKAGLAVPNTLTSFQVQHACAGGTLSMLSVAAQLATCPDKGDSGLVICSDIARYPTYSTAEITQGAGATALKVTSDPRLIELDLSTIGYYSKDVDDFFRPLGSKTAMVKGSYSIQCYKESLEQAFLDHCRRREKTPAQVLKNAGFFAIHTPFRNMPEIAFRDLLSKYLDLDTEAIRAFLYDRGLLDAVEAVAEIGNLYTGAIYLALAFTLSRRYAEIGRGIVGKEVLVASYGSGSTMTVISGRLAEGAPELIESWNLDSILTETREASIEEYQQWIDGPYAPKNKSRDQDHEENSGSRFTLEAIREDGYREYTYKKPISNPAEKSPSPIDLYRPE